MPSDVFGTYRLVRRLGVGASAEVWLASDSQHGRTVVLKFARPDYEEHGYREMLLKEGRTLQMLDHPNVVRVYESGEEGATAYLALEFVDGTELMTLLETAAARHERVPLPVGLRIAHELCLALSAAHTAINENGRPLELVHRDVTPHNVMISKRGEVKLLDFGIVKIPGLNQTRPGMIKGKTAYLAPEQAVDGKLDGRSDLFAVGLILYQMLAGRPAYEGATVTELYRAAVEARVKSIFESAPDLPSEVRQLVTRSLEKNPDRRFQTAEGFAEALKACGAMANALSVSQWRAALAVPGEP